MKTYLKEHQAEAFKKIADEVRPHSGDESWFIGDDDSVLRRKFMQLGSTKTEFFNPLIDAEQWIECLMWYQEEIWFHKGDTITYEQKLELLTSAIESREALLIAMLEVIDEH